MKGVTKWILAASLLVGVAPPCGAETPPFQIIYRQDKVVADEQKTTSNVMINVINRSGVEAKDLTVYIPVPNPYLFVGMPVLVGTMPDGHQAETLYRSELSNEVIATSEPEERIVWRIEYVNGNGEQSAVEIKGERGL